MRPLSIKYQLLCVLLKMILFWTLRVCFSHYHYKICSDVEVEHFIVSRIGSSGHEAIPHYTIYHGKCFAVRHYGLWVKSANSMQMTYLFKYSNWKKRIKSKYFTPNLNQYFVGKSCWMAHIILKYWGNALKYLFLPIEAVIAFKMTMDDTIFKFIVIYF